MLKERGDGGRMNADFNLLLADRVHNLVEDVRNPLSRLNKEHDIKEAYLFGPYPGLWQIQHERMLVSLLWS
jgi:hypothetical protein